MRRPSTYRTTRNEVVTLTALLKVACALLQENDVAFPKVLERWYSSQRQLTWLDQPKPSPKRAELSIDAAQQILKQYGDIT